MASSDRSDPAFASGPESSASLPGDNEPIDVSFAPAADPPPAAAKVSARGPGWAALAVASLLAALAGGLTGWLLPRPGPQDLSDRLAALETGLTATRTEVSALAPAQAASEARTNARLTEIDGRLTRALPDVSSLSARVDDLAGQVEAMSGAEGGTGLMAPIELGRALALLREDVDRLTAQSAPASTVSAGPDVSALDARLSALEARPPALATPAAADTAPTLQDQGMARAALSDILSASERGAPFISAYERLTRALPGNSDVQRLSNFAVTGAPTLGTLLAEFPALQSSVLAAGGPQARSDGWDWARRAAEGLVSVRRTDAEGMSALSRLDGAHARLRAGDLPGAVGLLRPLTGAEAQAAASWLARAQARLDLDAAVQAVGLSLPRPTP